jgi:hypothetical protein
VHTHRVRPLALQATFEELEKWALSNPDPAANMASARQELAEIYLDMHIK